MAMQIKFNEDYKEICIYNGVINDKYEFTVKVNFDSIIKKNIINDIVITYDISADFSKDDAIRRIEKLVREWYYIDE